MENQATFDSRENLQAASNAILKASSLLYFQEALHKEQYEDCTELLQKAREFGAKQSEISEIIAKYVRGVKAGRESEANKGRLTYRRF